MNYATNYGDSLMNSDLYMVHPSKGPAGGWYSSALWTNLPSIGCLMKSTLKVQRSFERSLRSTTRERYSSAVFTGNNFEFKKKFHVSMVTLSTNTPLGSLSADRLAGKTQGDVGLEALDVLNGLADVGVLVLANVELTAPVRQLGAVPRTFVTP